MINPEEFDFVDTPSALFRFVLIHPIEGVMYFANPQIRDEYAEEAAKDLTGDDLLGLCGAEIDILFDLPERVH